MEDTHKSSRSGRSVYSSKQPVAGIALALVCSFSFTATLALAGESPPAPTVLSAGSASRSVGSQENVPTASIKEGIPLTGEVSNASHQRLDSGALMLSPEQNTVVETPFGSVSVAAKSLALIISHPSGLSVYDMHDGRLNAVVMNDGISTFALSPGRCTVFAKSSINSFEEVNPAQFVGYRQLASRTLSSGIKLYEAEFDIMSMMRGLPPAALKTLRALDNAKTTENVLKTAVIVTQLHQSNEPFKLYLAPELTAPPASAQR